MFASALSQEKKTCRRLAMARRQAIEAVQAEAAAMAVCSVWDDLAASLPSGNCTIAMYLAAGSEMETDGLMRKLADQGCKLALPVTQPQDDSMMFRSYRPGDKLVKGGFGMMEPDPAQAEVEPEVVVLPLLGFDGVGTRLGRGGGHYDRALSVLRSRKTIQAVGLAYEVQFFEALPCEPHDEKLNAVITESCVRLFDG
ncbi:MAG: 5-formyltetrahydrofolate cyclo-ligase [Parvibaculales bacterium]